MIHARANARGDEADAKPLPAESGFDDPTRPAIWDARAWKDVTRCADLDEAFADLGLRAAAERRSGGRDAEHPPAPPEPKPSLTLVFTGQFERDVKRMESQGKDVSKLRAVMNAIFKRRPLEPSRVDHPLRGEWKWCRDCHVEGDWVLRYDSTGPEAVFLRTGAHTDLGF